MKLELDHEDILILYRHAKALAGALEKVLASKMLLRCSICNKPHHKNVACSWVGG